MNLFKWGYRYYRKRLPVAIICQIMGEIAIFIGLIAPLLSQILIDGVINYTPGKEVPVNDFLSFLISGKFGELGSFRLFLSLAIIIVSVIFIRTLLFYFRNVWFRKNFLPIENALRYAEYEKLFRLSNKALAGYNTGDLLTTLDSDAVQLKDLYAFYTLLIIDVVFQLIVIGIFLFTIKAELLIIIAALVPFLLFFLRKYVKISRKVSNEIRDRNAEMNLVSQESVNGIRLIKAYANEAREAERFRTCNENSRNALIKQVSVQSKYNIVFNAIRQVAYVVSVAVCGYFAIKGELQIGQLLACTSYVVTFMGAVTNLNNFLFATQQLCVSGDRVVKFMAAEELVDTHRVEKIENFDIEVKDLTVEIDGNDVLKGINLKIPYGTKLGVMGSTGSGKTVLLKSLGAIIPPKSGSVTIGGRNIEEYDKEEIRRQFSFVFQDVFLFSDTIDANIAFAVPDAPFEDVKNAAKISKAHGFIKTMPSGYETIIGERGLGLSGGQRQRISVARALVKNSPVLVLDDATSALDRSTEKSLLETIKEKYPEKTMIISAHKVSSVKDCDVIIYMHDGKIAEIGTYDELIAQGGMFAEIDKIQSEASEVN
ncbi:MAG: ABC transporter ATP-binding protein [Clostridia bacterium]|nr:ABC transporter ATP-binding protein [Clostridia bacterium]